MICECSKCHNLSYLAEDPFGVSGGISTRFQTNYLFGDKKEITHMATTTKKEQLIEAIRDCIYEVLEEELDRKLQEAKRRPARSAASLKESRDAKIKAIKERIAARKAAALREAKIAKMRQIVKEHDAKKRRAASKKS